MGFGKHHGEPRRILSLGEAKWAKYGGTGFAPDLAASGERVLAMGLDELYASPAEV